MIAVAPLELSAFDWRTPDYAPIVQARWERVQKLRAKPSIVRHLKAYYAQNPVSFIADWGMTADPRLAMIPGRQVVMPFVMFPKQVDWLHWALRHLRERSPGLTEKSRDCGVSWLAVSLCVTLAIFNYGFAAGFGSATEEKIDRTGDPDTLFWKARTFLQYLPAEFRGGFDEGKHSAHMRLRFPETGSSVTGQAGDTIGRGGRKSIYVIDEAAHVEHGEVIDASLASTTDCRIDVSSVAGMANSFAQRRHSGKIDVFTFHWRDDPRKDDGWYEKQKRDLDAVTLEQEININYLASVYGQLIPAEFVKSAIGAFDKLGLAPSGAKRSALDVADEGYDMCAYAGREGMVLRTLDQWSGKGSDTYLTAVKAVNLHETFGADEMEYDGDGLGAFMRGDVNKMNEERREQGRPEIHVEAFRGSAAVDDPEGEIVQGRRNEDYFANLNAQSWWWLRVLFQNTHRAINGEQDVDPDQMISIDPALPYLSELVRELSQPTYKLNVAGKVIVDKAPKLANGRSAKSPNLADAVKILYNPTSHHMEVWRRLGSRL